MSTRIYVSTLEASYFDTHLLGCDIKPPTKGDYSVGDIVISSEQQNDVLGWVCVKEGSPGEWKVICDIIEVKNGIKKNANDITKLASRVTKNEADIRGLNIDISDMNNMMEDNNSDLEAKIAINTTNINNLGVEVNTNKNNISKNTNSINDIKAQLDNAKKTMNTINEQVIANADDISSLERDMESINNRVENMGSTNGETLSGIRNELNILKNNVGKEGTTSTPATGIHKELNDLQKEFDDLKDLVIDGDDDINSVIQNLQKVDENINKEINDIKELIASNEADNDEIIEVLQKEIDDNKDDITELQKGVKDNKTEIDDLKQGLIDSLKEKNIDVKDNISWKELFGLLLQGLVKPEDPEEPEIPDEPIDIPCTNITLNNTTIHFTEKGATKTIVPTLYPANTTEKVVWSTNNNAVATVNNGVVTSVGQGDCTITARCGSVSASCYVTIDISENKECTSIRFTESSLKIHIDQVTDLKEILVIEPEGCTDPVEWVADNIILEINNGVIKGLAEGSTKVQARCGGLSANINITVVPKTTEDLGEGILLYKAGTQYNDTEFRNLCLANPSVSLTNDGIYHNLQNSTHVWFSYDGYIDYSDYDRIEITAYTENSQQQPMIGIGITSVSGQCGHQQYSSWTGTSHGNVVLMYNVTETKYTIPINYDSSGYGYLLLWMHRNEGGVGGVYITEIRVIPKKTEINDPIEIIDDEITIQVGERYDATKLYTLQEGYNVQYKYSSIIAIEGEHTIVGKEVGTTELEIICGGIVKTVTLNVVEEHTPIEPR